MNRCGIVILAALLVMAIVARGQDEPPRGEFGPPARGSGRGGVELGGPMLGPMMGRDVQRLMLLRMPEVHDELALNHVQRQSLQTVMRDFDREWRSVLESLAPPPGEFEFRPPPFEELEQKSNAIAAKFQSIVEEHLSDAQKGRLEQLQRQQAFPASLLDESVKDQLELTTEQLRQLALFRDAPPFLPPQERAQWANDALAVLTPAQRDKWQQLSGNPFEFPGPQQRRGREGRRGAPDGEGPMGFGPPDGPFFPGSRGGPGGPGGFAPMNQERKLLPEFDTNGDGWLNDEERQNARANGSVPGARGPGMFGRRGGGTNRQPQSGARISPTDVAPLEGDLYDPTVLRTLFLDFSNSDWEAELEAFNNTDVDVPATLIVDGQTYPNVGVHFRGMSSYGAVPRGFKRSLNVSLDFIDSNQRLNGYKTLNLLNSHGDPSFMHTVLYAEIARNFIPAPKANFVRVVINGEDWGLYVNAQQFNKDFVAENYPSSKGARWKVPGNPGARGGLEYLGDTIDLYRQRYEIKSDDKDESWKKLIDLCRTLNETPVDQLEEALADKLDIDGVLWFLALDVALVNSDGYWVRASDYNLCMSPEGKFHVIPHDLNETFSTEMMGPRMGGGPERGRGAGGVPGGEPENNARPGFGPPGMASGGGVRLDPLVGLNDPTKPLRSRLLAVPSLRAQYLRNVRTIAEKWLDWETLEPRIAQHAELIEPVLVDDVKKLSSLPEFYRAIARTPTGEENPRDSGRGDIVPSRGDNDPGRDRMGSGRGLGLRDFVNQRREYLLQHPAILELDR